jgi:hypothetical protein
VRLPGDPDVGIIGRDYGLMGVCPLLQGSPKGTRGIKKARPIRPALVSCSGGFLSANVPVSASLRLGSYQLNCQGLGRFLQRRRPNPTNPLPKSRRLPGMGAWPTCTLWLEYGARFMGVEVAPPEFDFLHETMPGIVKIAPSANTIIIFDKLLFIFCFCLINFHLVMIQTSGFPASYNNGRYLRIDAVKSTLNKTLADPPLNTAFS